MRKKEVVFSVITIIMVVAFIVAVVLLMYKSINRNGSYEQAREDDRFIQISSVDGWIYVDKETKVQYLFIKRYNAGGLTILVDENGKPLLYEG